MKVKKLTFNSRGYPQILRDIPSPPKQVYYTGAPLSELLARPVIAIVGSRQMSPYGKEVTIKLSARLAEQGITVVSGLAMGVDCTAQRAALEAGGKVIAVLPGPLDNILPSTNRRLAHDILAVGGALVSEYGPGEIAYKQNFIARNRIVSGLAQALLITEAGEKSGSLHTARFALDQGRDVLAVPGNITSPISAGTNNLLKSGARPVTDYEDVLHAMGLEVRAASAKDPKGRNEHEQTVLNLMVQGVKAGDQLLEKSRLTASQFSQVLTMLEISSKIRPLGANHWALY